MSVKDRRALAVQVIELSDDDEQTPVVAIGKQTLEDQESSIWHYVGPRGETKGPYSMSLLKRWSNSSSYALKCKVWKIGQSQEQAILMGDALHQIFPRK
ncbi:hypothetical protein L1049_015075 [Liquidambar formosana]|uniref:GYF domain-containing protein n=1 Tax=Liquidambar formosana TaxID=63359 RepID=A0AAP0WZG7_LIQFO